VGVIVSSNDFNELRHHHDLRDDYRYDSRRYDRYEDRRVIIKREEIYVPQVYQEQQRVYRDPHYKHNEHYDQRDDRHEDRHDRRDDDDRYEGRRH